MIDVNISDSIVVYSMPLQLGYLTCSPGSSAAKAIAKSDPQLLSLQNATPLINDPRQYATSLLSALGLWDGQEPTEMYRELSH